MPIPRSPMIDDDGSGTTGTIINNAWKQELYSQIDASAWVLGPHSDLVTAGAQIDNWPCPSTHLIFVSGSGGTLTGMTPAPAGTMKIFYNIGGSLTFVNASGASAAVNRFVGVGNTDTVLPSYRSQTLVYSEGLASWVLLT